ncbi:serine/arginine repetitive matrix protein 1 [Achroia grisella]|uniref:serine/arginine repetitive matrix protein 1 n=1 Tax=Achroia grisella TaxID=688607 RepID=UPI0027D2FD69|nr:serine/arginine repetitive matrix protein 1 [Achroia grisella]
MMVETILESSQDFGMSNGSLPQWKRELLQRRAARSRPTTFTAPAHPPPAARADLAADLADEDEELRYGPGIVKRLKSRYLSLALRDAPRRRPSVLRRATSLEHLLDERPPPAPRPPGPRPPRPASVAAPPAVLGPTTRRDFVKRARSVDALSRLDAREELHPPSPSPPPLTVIPVAPPPTPPPLASPPVSSPGVAPPPLSPRPPIVRSARPPRRPTPLLRETERPPPDVVRSTLRKFESAPTRRTAPAARVSAVLRGLESAPRTSTPEPRDPSADCRSPSPAIADVSAIDETECAVVSAEAKPVSRAALEGIARAGSSMRFCFEVPPRGSHLPPLAAANPVLIGRARRVGVIRPMPAPTLTRPTSTPTPPPLVADVDEKVAEVTPRLATPPPVDNEPALTARPERREPPPSAVVEPIVRSLPEERHPTPTPTSTDSSRVESPRPPSTREATPEPTETRPIVIEIDNKPITNGHTDVYKSKIETRLGGAGIERAWNGTPDKIASVELKEKKVNSETKSAVPWARVSGEGGGGSPVGARRARAPPPAATSIVFNFSNRKEVPDYIENDGLIHRTSKKNRIKAGEPGVVVLDPAALARADSDPEEDGDGEEEMGGPPSPCGVRFVNDNVIINGRSSMPNKPNRDRISKLKLQFDDSLTRTFEYPSETSLCEDSPPEEHPTARLAANTHIASSSLARYTPSKTLADAFQLGVTRRLVNDVQSNGAAEAAASETDTGDARPCGADAARSWSDARAAATDLLF